MKHVAILRHSEYNPATGALTSAGRELCEKAKSTIDHPVLVIAGPAPRCVETARLLTDAEPTVDPRAATPTFPATARDQILHIQATHPLGVVAAFMQIPGLKDPWQAQGQALLELIIETLDRLHDDQSALIISHDGTMVAAEKLLKHESFDTVDHTFGQLAGFVVEIGPVITRYVEPPQ